MGTSTLSAAPGDHLQRLAHHAWRNARLYGEAPAWIDTARNEWLSHGGLYEQLERAIGHLRARQLRAGQVVCLVLTRSRHFMPLLLACIELDLILAPVAPDARELQATLRDVRPRLLLHDGELPLEGLASLGKIPVLPVEELMLAGGPPAFLGNRACAELHQAPALLIKTSGTTGQAKYVALSESNLVANATRLQQRFGCCPEERILCTLPWSHMNAIMLTGCLPLVAGCTTVYCNISRAQDPIGLIRQSQATIASLTPTLIAFVLHRRQAGQDLKGLRWIFCGAAPLDAALWRDGEALLGCAIHQGYGLTETTCWVTASLAGHACDYRGVGTLLSGELQIDGRRELQVATTTAPFPSGTGVLGEIRVRGPLLMCGYRGGDGRWVSQVTGDGFFATGDIGYIDERGTVHVVGRVKEVVIRAGINIVPHTIDAIVRDHPAVTDSKTVGIADPLLGEKLVTAYVANAPLEMELRRHVAARLPSHYLPNDYVRIDQLPLTPVGKVALGELRGRVSGDFSRQAFNALNTWKFKRCHPRSPERIIASLQHSLLASGTFRFLCYWGVGSKLAASAVDRQALQRLRAFIDGAKVHASVGVSLRLLLTDIHGQLNGKPSQRIEQYLGEIEALAGSHGFECVRSSALWARHRLCPDQLTRQAHALSLAQITQANAIAPELLVRLESSAYRHVEVGDADEGLKRYLLACQRERQMIADEHAGYVFLSYNDPDMDFLTAPLPTLAIYSSRRGTTLKPWFCSE